MPFVGKEFTVSYIDYFIFFFLEFEAFKRWGIQESLQLLDILSVKVKDSHKIAGKGLFIV